MAKTRYFKVRLQLEIRQIIRVYDESRPGWSKRKIQDQNKILYSNFGVETGEKADNDLILQVIMKTLDSKFKDSPPLYGVLPPINYRIVSGPKIKEVGSYEKLLLSFP